MNTVQVPLLRPHKLKKGSLMQKTFIDAASVMHQFSVRPTVKSIRRNGHRPAVDLVTLVW